MDNEKDLYIKEKLQNDKLISKNANDIINNFFDMEDVKMEKNKNYKEKSKKLHFSEKWKKILATAASLVVIFGVANVYASTKGYGNIFFLIKYLITGENSYVNGKDEILTDRDLTISYEPINITENINVVIKKLQIKNNEAKLFILVNEQDANDSDVPLKYKVYNKENKLLCDQKSSKEGNVSTYTEELVLNNYKEDNTKLKLEVYSSKSELITTININLDTQTIEVVGEQEALSKISEIELKNFLNYVSGLSRKENGITKNEKYVDLAISMLLNNKISDGKEFSYKNRNVVGFSVEDVDNMINYSFAKNDIKNFKNGDFIIKVNNGGQNYYIYNVNTDFAFEGECININNISFCNGIYTVTYTFYLRGGEPDDDVNINNYEIFEQTVYIRLNENNKYSKFKLVSEDNAEIISGVGNNNTNIEQNNNINNTNTITNTTNTVNNTNTSSNVNNNTTTNNTNNNSGNSYNNTTSYSNTTVPSDNNQTNNNESPAVEQPSNHGTAENIDNYASTMSWTEYWAPGIKFQYPTIFELTEEGGYYRGNNQGELTTRITGIAVGKNPDTNERVESKLMIKIYNPAFISESEANIRMYSNGYERGSLENKRGIKWYVTSSNTPNEPGYTYSESYSNVERSSDGSYIENRVEFVTDNIENYKVRNIINWLLGSTQLTSW